MDTLKDLIDALLILTQGALVLRFIILCVQAADQEAQEQARYKKQKRTVVLAFVLLVCVYDIPSLLAAYFGR